MLTYKVIAEHIAIPCLQHKARVRHRQLQLEVPPVIKRPLP
jgi:hypothetical protein